MESQDPQQQAQLDNALNRLAVAKKLNQILLSQITRSAKCFYSASTENALLKAELAAMPGGAPSYQQGQMRR